MNGLPDEVMERASWRFSTAFDEKAPPFFPERLFCYAKSEMCKFDGWCQAQTDAEAAGLQVKHEHSYWGWRKCHTEHYWAWYAKDLEEDADDRGQRVPVLRTKL